MQTPRSPFSLSAVSANTCAGLPTDFFLTVHVLKKKKKTPPETSPHLPDVFKGSVKGVGLFAGHPLQELTGKLAELDMLQSLVL